MSLVEIKDMSKVKVQTRLIRVKIGLDEKELLFIACGSNHCAGIEPSSDRVFYFPQSNGYSYTYYPKNEKPCFEKF